jgi:murein DD-endopeptidase MepM/ murein hydrolase activator NlpD
VKLPVFGVITSRFSRSRWHPILHLFRPHKGVDVAAPYGSNITAPAAGRVTFVGRKLGDGLMVELDHGAGVQSIYAHCSAVKVRVGDFVSFGDVIAQVGSSGLSTAPHVHFEVRVRGEPVDPLKYLITARLTPMQKPATAASAGVMQAGSPAPVHRPQDRAAGSGSDEP